MPSATTRDRCADVEAAPLNLPEKHCHEHQLAFARLPVGRFGGAVTDHLPAHLQKIKGGAQPFWTVGVGSPTAVDYTVNAQGEWSVTK